MMVSNGPTKYRPPEPTGVPGGGQSANDVKRTILSSWDNTSGLVPLHIQPRGAGRGPRPDSQATAPPGHSLSSCSFTTSVMGAHSLPVVFLPPPTQALQHPGPLPPTQTTNKQILPHSTSLACFRAAESLEDGLKYRLLGLTLIQEVWGGT